MDKLSDSISLTGGRATASSRRLRLLVVSYMAWAVYSPRGIRTRTLLAELAREWEIGLISGPSSDGAPTRKPKRGPSWSLISRLAASLFLDKYEPHARLHCASLPPADAAYLIGYPYSPLVYAARSLAKAGIPYLVDVGDPLALTAEQPDVQRAALWRALRLERRVWHHAAGAIVTTRGHAEGLARLFPDLPILVRPNGTTVQPASDTSAPRPRDGCLRLGHFGSVYDARLDVSKLLDSLADSGRWAAVELHQYGPDWTNRLGNVTSAQVIGHAQLPWAEVQREAAKLDAGLVIGNRDRTLLPSKTIDYLTLPVPRIAVVNPARDDALAEYLEDKPAWLVVAHDALDAPAQIYEHVSRPWASQALAAPASEGWDAVARAIASFVRERLLPVDEPNAVHA